jgi:hypothetical protein
MTDIYKVRIDYKEFREYLVETDKKGPWGDIYFHQVFDKYVVDDKIEIEYKYGESIDDVTTLIWRVVGDENKTARKVTFTGSSDFSFWWCHLTDEYEDEDEEE